MEECPVCYCNQAHCKLICSHSFCKSCVKDWYYASDEPSCPMCRKRLYFKGMYRVIPEWEQERFDRKNEEAFAEVIESLFEEPEPEEDVEWTDDEDDSSDWETDSDEGSESEWDFELPSADYRLAEIQSIQERFAILQNGGHFVEPEFLDSDFYTVCNDYQHVWYDNPPLDDRLFVSKHSGVGDQRRCGARVQGKRDAAVVVEVIIALF